MANVAFFANEADCSIVVNWINEESQLAYILPDGEHRWKAVSEVDAPAVYGRMLFLWHIASGPLPLCRAQGVADLLIDDPFSGWREERTAADASLPWLGPGYPGVFDFKIRPVSNYIKYWRKPVELAPPTTRVIGRSDFGWVGKSYKPKPGTAALWKKIEGFIYGQSTPIDPQGWGKPGSNPTPESVADDRSYVAMPGALAEMRRGTPWNGGPL